MNIDAIILSNTSDLSHYGMTCRTINSLRESDKFNNIEKIIVVESQDASDFKLSGFNYYNCEVIHPQEKFSYNKFLNIGLEKSASDWILICNNDLVFTKTWLLNMKNVVEKYPDFKSFSPLCPNWHLHQNVDGELLEGYTVSKNVCGWCILLHRSVLVECDLFDEQFAFWYQDNDYAMTLKSKDIKHALVPVSRVYHMVSKSHDLLVDRKYELTDGQQQIFNKKWMI